MVFENCTFKMYVRQLAMLDIVNDLNSLEEIIYSYFITEVKKLEEKKELTFVDTRHLKSVSRVARYWVFEKLEGCVYIEVNIPIIVLPAIEQCLRLKREIINVSDKLLK